MEVLNLSIEDIDFGEKMVKPKSHSGETKRAWLSFSMRKPQFLNSTWKVERITTQNYFPCQTRTATLFGTKRDKDRFDYYASEVKGVVLLRDGFYRSK
jgi:hypothetical protein